MPPRSQHSNAFGPFQSRQRSPERARPITIARADQFLGLDACDRPGFLASLNTFDPPGGGTQFVTEVVRRVVAGKARPDVLTALARCSTTRTRCGPH